MTGIEIEIVKKTIQQDIQVRNETEITYLK